MKWKPSGPDPRLYRWKGGWPWPSQRAVGKASALGKDPLHTSREPASAVSGSPVPMLPRGGGSRAVLGRGHGVNDTELQVAGPAPCKVVMLRRTGTGSGSSPFGTVGEGHKVLLYDLQRGGQPGRRLSLGPQVV